MTEQERIELILESARKFEAAYRRWAVASLRMLKALDEAKKAATLLTTSSKQSARPDGF